MDSKHMQDFMLRAKLSIARRNVSIVLQSDFLLLRIKVNIYNIYCCSV